ncbi:MAG: energy transducer TonB, partial [Pseudolabrys sp.]
IREQRKRRERLAMRTPEPTTPSKHKAARATAPHAGARRHNPNAVPRWKTALVLRLQRYKRYPAAAQARGVQGVARLAFSVDRSGHVHHAHIARSSGSSLLDRATMQLIARAQPLPPPPPEVHGAQIAIVVPIRYNLR